MRFDSGHPSPASNDASKAATFGELLRAYRVRARLSQELLAERAQISADAVSSLERGTRRSPYRSTVALLSKALDLDVQDSEALELARRGARRQPVRNNAASHLPVERTSFVGREGDIANIVQILGRSRLLTLTGSGGVGKTRAAIESARRIGSDSWDEIWFVDLAPLTEGAAIAAKIAMTIQPLLTDQADTLSGLASALANRRMLLIFDNCEHIVVAAANAAAVLLDGCPQLAILATSREPLNISGEFVYRLPPLSLPDALPVGLEDAQAYSVVDLFVQRAELADTRISFSAENLDTIVRIARRLDGIPLAIELAAAQLPTIGLRALEERLDRHLDISPGRRDLPSRQQTVHATIAWSYDLLSADERDVLCTASVFSGGFTLEAVEIVCSGEAFNRSSIAPLVSSLVNKSLVDVEYLRDAVRYQLLDSVRSFARERLREADGEESALRRHAAWLATLADEMYEKYPAEMPIEVSAALVPEVDNVRAAVVWSLKAPLSADRGFAGRILPGLYTLSDVTGGRREHRHLIETALERIDESEHPIVVANLLLAFIMRAHLEGVALDVIDRAIPLFERNGDPHALLRLHIVLSCAFAEHGKFAEAERSAEVALTLMSAERLESSMLRAALMVNRCLSRILQGRFDEALADVAEAERVALTYFDDRYFVLCRCDPRVVQIEFERGNLFRALEITQRMLSSEFGWVHEVALQAVSGAVNLQLLLGDVAAAAASTHDLLGRMRPTMSSSYPACEYAASVAAMRGHAHIAARLLGFIGAVEERVRFRRMNMRQRTYEALRARLARQLDEKTLAAELATGSRWTSDAAIAEAQAALQLESVASERDLESSNHSLESL
jgi:predicted ATPase/DNA-binding XRE family transcriptional regulator